VIEKHCEICKNPFSTMFRIQYKPNKKRVFVCEPCLRFVKKTTLTINMEEGHGKNKEINPDFFFNLLRIRFKKPVEKLCNKTKTTQKNYIMNLKRFYW
tara:strand:+ start:240 stop:533 length:294 start_codon:yes stop_codon:yes gene_type:complete